MGKLLIFIGLLILAYVLLSGAGQQMLSVPSVDDQRIAGERMLQDAQRYARGTETAIAALGESRAYELLQQSIAKTERAADYQATQAAFSIRQTEAAIQKTAVVEDARGTQAAQQTATVQAVVHELTREAGYLQLTADAAQIANYQTQVAIEARSTSLTLQREEAVNAVMAWLPIGLQIITYSIAAAILLLLALAVRRMPRSYRKGTILAYPHGIVDPERSTGPVVPVDNGRPQVPAPSQDPHQPQVTARAQAIEALKSAPPGRTPPPAVFRPGEAPQISSGNAPLSAPWREIESRSPGKFLLGYDPNARDASGRPLKIEADPTAAAPHLLMAGTTGSGKTRLGLRPLITQALGDGYQVIILDRSGVDYDVFSDSRNAKLIRVDDKPEMIAEYLRRIYGEIQHRMSLLSLARASTWTRLPNAGPGILVVVDEFATLGEHLRSIDPSLREELWAAARNIAGEGRKTGVVLAIALQNPSRDNIDMSLRRQCTRIAFRVQDRDASQIVLGAVGAEQLPQGHFMTVVNGLQHGVGFHPSDDDIMRYLARHQAPALPAPDWLDVESRTVQHDPIEDTQPVRVRSNGSVSAETMLIAEQIRETWEGGGSKRAMARAAGLEYAGSSAAKIDKAIAYCEQYFATTTTANAPHMADVE
jgi:hypothetical protein